MGTYGFDKLAAFIKADPTKLALLLAATVQIDKWALDNPAANSAAGLKAATPTTVAPQTWTAADLIGAGKTELAAFPRQLVFTTAGATPADAPANVVITGKDAQGEDQTETLALAQTATTATSLKYWSSITSIAFAAADGTGATIALGWAISIAFPWVPKAITGGVAVIQEFTNGVPSATRGTYTAPSSNVPTGAVSFNSAPDGSKDYVVYAERDLSL